MIKQQTTDATTYATTYALHHHAAFPVKNPAIAEAMPKLLSSDPIAARPFGLRINDPSPPASLGGSETTCLQSHHPQSHHPHSKNQRLEAIAVILPATALIGSSAPSATSIHSYRRSRRTLCMYTQRIDA
jgi:hypothetical protein